MFTGLIQRMGHVRRAEAQGPGMRMVLDAGSWDRPVEIGESIAVNGCCLTVIEVTGELLAFDLGPETLRRTNLGQLDVGGRVNLERSLCLGDPLGGHLVSGHVDTVGTLARRDDQQAWSMFYFRVPPELTPQMAPKGSIAVDGVSLTLVDVDDSGFSVQLIPHTLAVTTLGSRRAGDAVNIETDLLAKYVESQLRAWRNERS